MRAVETVLSNLQDVRHMGFSYMKHHVSTSATVRGIGRVTVRRGSDAKVFSQVFSSKQYELRYVRQFDEIRRRFGDIKTCGKIPLIIDLGANNGASALWFISRFPGSRVVAVEPDPDNAATCRHNVRGQNVVVLEAAIGSEAGMVNLITDNREDWTVTTKRSAGGAVQLLTVPEILERNGDCELFMVKIDIEGFESDLFQSSTEWLLKTKVVFIEPHDWYFPGSSRHFQRVLGGMDFDLLIKDENLIYVQREARADSSSGE
jgi:FkbM family methyltransferase